MRKFITLFPRLFRSKESQDLKLFKKSNKGKRYDIDLYPYLMRFFKEGREERERCDAYSLYAYRSKKEGYGSVELHAIYVDAVFSFILFKDKNPIANIGFNIEADNSILVKQIQGVRGRQDELGFLRWEKMLLQIVMDWARRNKFKKISVIRSIDSKWHRDYDKERRERMYLKYDVTARRMGFKYDVNKKLYFLYL